MEPNALDVVIVGVLTANLLTVALLWCIRAIAVSERPPIWAMLGSLVISLGLVASYWTML